MSCPLCKGKMVEGKTTLPYEDNEKMIVIKDVPALVCEQCGDSFIEMPIARQVEIMLSQAKQDGLTLGFVSYRQAA